MLTVAPHACTTLRIHGSCGPVRAATVSTPQEYPLLPFAFIATATSTGWPTVKTGAPEIANAAAKSSALWVGQRNQTRRFGFAHGQNPRPQYA